MALGYDPVAYEEWYHTARGAWIGEVEFRLIMCLLQPSMGATLLDVGSGTGYFGRRLATAELQVTGIDPDPEMVGYARRRGMDVAYIEGTANELPFQDRSFDHVTAVTSLCFMSEPQRALAELWRVSRHNVVLGLLNRYSLLFRQKQGEGGYRSARWYNAKEACSWWLDLQPVPRVVARTAVFRPNGDAIARRIEGALPNILPWGAFLAIALYKTSK
ncbi:MAG: class I SAM-dependent methyltransferase [Sulfuricaulis sp.]